MLIASLRHLLLAALLTVALGTAAPASAAVTTHLDGSRGGSAVTTFTVVDGCTTTSTYVFATTLLLRPHDALTRYADVVVDTTDTCTGEQSLLVGVVDPLVLRQTDARVGTVAGEVELLIRTTGASAGVHTLEVRVVAAGQPEHGRGGFVHRWAGGQTVYQAVGSFAEASATGSLVTPTGPTCWPA